MNRLLRHDALNLVLLMCISILFRPIFSRNLPRARFGRHRLELDMMLLLVRLPLLLKSHFVAFLHLVNVLHLWILLNELILIRRAFGRVCIEKQVRLVGLILVHRWMPLLFGALSLLHGSKTFQVSCYVESF